MNLDPVLTPADMEARLRRPHPTDMEPVILTREQTHRLARVLGDVIDASRGKHPESTDAILETADTAEAFLTHLAHPSATEGRIAELWDALDARPYFTPTIDYWETALLRYPDPSDTWWSRAGRERDDVAAAVQRSRE